MIAAALARAVLGVGLAAVPTAAGLDRMAPIPLDAMSPAQRKVADAILAGPRKSIEGPFNAWLRSPELADRLQRVGEYLRFNTSQTVLVAAISAPARK